MPKRLSKGWRPKEVNQLANHLVRLSTEPDAERPIKPRRKASKPKPTKAEISRIMAAMGRRGGRIGGKRRLVTLTPEERKDIAVKAARKRWDNAKRD